MYMCVYIYVYILLSTGRKSYKVTNTTIIRNTQWSAITHNNVTINRFSPRRPRSIRLRLLLRKGTNGVSTDGVSADGVSPRLGSHWNRSSGFRVVWNPVGKGRVMGHAWKGTDGVSTNGFSTNGVTSNFMFFDRGTFWVLPLTYFNLPKSHTSMAESPLRWTARHFFVRGIS